MSPPAPPRAARARHGGAGLRLPLPINSEFYEFKRVLHELIDFLLPRRKPRAPSADLSELIGGEREQGTDLLHGLDNVDVAEADDGERHDLAHREQEQDVGSRPPVTDEGCPSAVSLWSPFDNRSPAVAGSRSTMAGSGRLQIAHSNPLLEIETVWTALNIVTRSFSGVAIKMSFNVSLRPASARPKCARERGRCCVEPQNRLFCGTTSGRRHRDVTRGD
ncbi:hypothetical protein EVAR_37131_1 [Eumeta japonica]|uniref:Uncharacterized protein n=1 Tax=Eumeta variegata TaxID=151549 RepID=A0A4C1XQF4_EUMVA|nr:hypothetical protein EVAR_37131_1 [Eumeta japonica]